MQRIKGKHLVFKASITGINTQLLIDNSSEAKLIDELFVRTNCVLKVTVQFCFQCQNSQKWHFFEINDAICGLIHF